MKLETMTEHDLRKLVLSKLQVQGLGGVVSTMKSQFLQMSLSHDEFFAEIVLTDADRLGDAERVLSALKEELAEKAVSLDYIVRALWRIDPNSIKRDRRSLPASMPMRMHLGILFRAPLRSGQETAEAEVLVTSDALDIIAARLGNLPSEPFQWSADKEVDEEILKNLVVKFLEEQLSKGGESYWDPVKYPGLELNGAAASYLLGHSAALMELVEAVNDAFDPMALPAFLKALDLTPIRIKEFDLVLPELSNFLGGAYPRGQAFSVSAPALYASLRPPEQDILRRHYLVKVERLLAERPELR